MQNLLLPKNHPRWTLKWSIWFHIIVLDIDECRDQLDDCSTLQRCRNIDGSYECIDDDGKVINNNEDKCPPGYRYNNNKYVCDGK